MAENTVGTRKHRPIPTFILRPIQANEFDEMLSLIEQEGWILRINKFKMIAEKFKGCVYVAATDGGTHLGMICLLPTHDGEYIVGNAVVAKEYRGRGIGKKMLTEVQRIHANSTMSLCSVLGAVDFYRNCGFHEVGEIIECHFIRVEMKELESKMKRNSDVLIQPYSPDVFEELCQYDSNQRGYDMSRYLSIVSAVCDQLLMARRKLAGSIVGYAAGFMKESTMVFDGFYADNDDIALLLHW